MRNLRRVIRLYHDGPSTSFKCKTCNKYLSYHAERHRHSHSLTEDNKNAKISAYCAYFTKYILKTNWYYHKRTNDHKLKCAEKAYNGSDADGVKCIQSSFINRIITYLVEYNNKINLISENFLILLVSVNFKVNNFQKLKLYICMYVAISKYTIKIIFF